MYANLLQDLQGSRPHLAQLLIAQDAQVVARNDGLQTWRLTGNIAPSAGPVCHD
mgnify:CR=1 FL=1